MSRQAGSSGPLHTDTHMHTHNLHCKRRKAKPSGQPATSFPAMLKKCYTRVLLLPFLCPPLAISELFSPNTRPRSCGFQLWHTSGGTSNAPFSCFCSFSWSPGLGSRLPVASSENRQRTVNKRREQTRECTCSLFC